LEDPFDGKTRKTKPISNPLKTNILAYEAISQRGKGGVYRAIDVSVSPIRRCILKEGRRNGETDWDGRDGYWRVKHEDRVLCALGKHSIAVPKIYQRFEVEGHYYLVMEYVDGESLQSLMSKQRRKLVVTEIIRYGLQLARLLTEIHEAGWVWRDCKPTNIMVSRSGLLVALDFEGASAINRPDPTPWGTPGYVPRDILEDDVPATRLPEDLYALGAVLHQLVSGKAPANRVTKISAARRRMPQALTDIISELLSPNPELRPAASVVSRVLASI